MKKPWVIILVVVLLIIGVLFWRNKKAAQSKEATAVETATVKRKDFVKTIASSGKTKATKAVELKFQTSGKLSWVGVKEGDTVTAGQALASLDSRDVQNSLKKTLIDYSSQRSDFEEAWRTNWRAAAESHETIDHAPSEAIRIILEKNQWDLDKAVLDVEFKHLAVEYSTLITPIGGTVSHIDTPIAGVNITPAGSVFEVIDPTSLVFEAKIDEVDVGSLAIGQEATVSLDAFQQKTFTGKVSSIAYSAETSTGGATVFPVEIALTAVPGLRVGFNGDVVITTDKTPQALVIPVAAIRETDKSKYVYIKTKTGYAKTPVTIGLTGDSEALVESGLQEGDQVVTKGFSQVTTK